MQQDMCSGGQRNVRMIEWSSERHLFTAAGCIIVFILISIMRLYYILLSLVLVSCIGQDTIDDLAIPNRLDVEVVAPRQSLLMGQVVQLSATAAAPTGEIPSPQVLWESADAAIGIVNESGLFTAIGPGQVAVTARLGASQSEPLLITVVAGNDEVAAVTITADSFQSGDQLPVGDFLNLMATARNVNDAVLEGQSFSWQSLNPSFATVDANGLVQGLADGEARIVATAGAVQSDPFVIMVGDATQTVTRMGTFMDNGGYEASGTATLIQEGGELRIELSSDFSTEVALGTYLYLSNSLAGSTTFSSGLEIANLSSSSSGAQSYSISAIDPGVNIDDYAYVVLLCRPAQINFGFAELN